jgi:hypothetical protein
LPRATPNALRILLGFFIVMQILGTGEAPPCSPLFIPT